MRNVASGIQIQFLKPFASLRPLFYSCVVGFNNFEKKKELESILYDRVLAAGHPSSLTDLARQGFIRWLYCFTRFARYCATRTLDSHEKLFSWTQH